MEPTREQKLEKYKKLPDDLRETIMSVNTSEKFYTVGQKHQLNIEQVEILSKQAGLVMLGFEHPSKFIGNIAKALNLPEEKARAIAEDINTEIFRPVRESLKKIHNISETPPPIMPSPPVPLPTPLPTLPPPKPELASIPARPSGGAAPASLEFQKKELPPPEDETKLNREEILAGIENPVLARPARIASLASSAAIASKPEIKEVTSKPNYQDDPYREPLK